jgi:hypothetical protein
VNAHEARRNKKDRIDDPLGLGNDRITLMAMMVWRDADWIYRTLEKALTDEIGQARQTGASNSEALLVSSMIAS